MPWSRRFTTCCLSIPWKKRPPMSEPLVLRPEIYRDQVDSSSFGVVEKPLSTWERIYNQSAVRKVCILIMLAVFWEIYARLLNNALLFPTFTSTIEAFYEAD